MVVHAARIGMREAVEPDMISFADDVILDGLVKGIPPLSRVALAEIGRQGWNLLRGDIPLPAAILKRNALDRNARWMQAFVRRGGALLAPHVKTTMCPAIIRRQLDNGAWGVTVATVQQMLVCRRMGVSRILLASQPVGRSSSKSLSMRSTATRTSISTAWPIPSKA
jgi:D-serine dehydratase